MASHELPGGLVDIVKDKKKKEKDLDSEDDGGHEVDPLCRRLHPTLGVGCRRVWGLEHHGHDVEEYAEDLPTTKSVKGPWV